MTEQSQPSLVLGYVKIIVIRFSHPLFPCGCDAGLHGALVFESPLFGITTRPGLEPGLGRPGLLYPDKFD